MKKQTSAGAVVGVSVLLSLALYLFLQLLLAGLAIRGILPERLLSGTQILTAGLAVLPGGLIAAKRTKLGALTATLVTAAGFAALLLLLGLGLYGGIDWTLGQGGGRLLAAGAGGIIAGLLSARPQKRRKRKRAG